jgi:hypothetical protein
MIKSRFTAMVTRSLSDRASILVASLLLIVLLGHALQQSLQAPRINATATALNRDRPDEAILQGEDIDGPADIGAYFREGYAWAQAHGVSVAALCASDSRAYRDGCRAFAEAQASRSSVARPADGR